MIGRLKGLVDGVGEDSALIDVGGVGYVVFASRRTLGALPGRGEAARLEIETHVREDHIHLYGFIDEAERAAFRMLTGVQGVGSRVALAILSVLAPDALTRAIAAQDKAAITRANGVGPKLAQRIVTELKDKVGAIALGQAARAGADAKGAGVVPAGAGAVNEDAVSALVNLGYGRSDAFAAVARVQASGQADLPLAELIRAGLKELSQ